LKLLPTYSAHVDSFFVVQIGFDAPTD